MSSGAGLATHSVSKRVIQSRKPKGNEEVEIEFMGDADRWEGENTHGSMLAPNIDGIKGLEGDPPIEPYV